MKKDIQNRADLSLLVHAFYSKIRLNEEIGPVFNETIKDWDSHLEKLIDFWESNLFAVRKYVGNPMLVHAKLDEQFKHTLDPTLFGLWLNLWFETIEELFEGENVEILKRRARKMGTVLLVAIYENRGPGYSDSMA
ncbi:group III truncated hemoglobin [Flavobacterium sp. GT3R68]|uniref:group III truncated hemoglobin n=1 Tax=Flavobacterium sp. GT3R68 TaxID=2594437 RepID=UPI000F869C93|nr:group III truncated hemoglobin [Flavobacterium sp. GT3R68]RTY93985.1 group III truncated hemoglobin [Flavobacterium sp. GSN2]TRW93401.1 group III truncated hemoglobin [Flavobacterium sp. GT3R68]